MKIAEHFTTSDGQEFYKEHTARNHAKTLSNKKVTLPGEEIKETDVKDIEVNGEELVASLEKYEGPTIILNQVTEGDAPEGVIVENISPEVETPEVEAPEVEAPEVETPEVETPEVEAPEVEAPVATAKKDSKTNTKK